jgi:hypothetical protein
MTKVTVDATLQGKLNNLTHPVELCDESGRLVGQFIPNLVEPRLDEEELERREREPDFSTAEVLAHLEKL